MANEYGGGGLDPAHHKVLAEEMARIRALPAATGMGLAMIGPTILELGTDEQRQRHIPKIVSGEAQVVAKDIQSLVQDLTLQACKPRQCSRAINSSSMAKIWTSGAQYANWMFASAY